MKGLDLAFKYYRDVGAPMIERRFASFSHCIAAGLSGPGSECFGFDDEISRDHDWGPGFCLWLPENEFGAIGKELQEAYGKLPKTYRGFGPRMASPGEEKRVGVWAISDFFQAYTGLDHAPDSLRQWMAIPEANLATCTNGRVFSDPLGEFSRWRSSLLQYYPEDIRLKKMASCCLKAAQAGQYNFARSGKRNEPFAVAYSETQFCFEVISLVFCINKQYAPFYKWLHRAVQALPVLGETVHGRVSELIAESHPEKKQKIIDAICGDIVQELNQSGLSDCKSDFLLDHAPVLTGKIKDPVLRQRVAVIN